MGAGSGSSKPYQQQQRQHCGTMAITNRPHIQRLLIVTTLAALLTVPSAARSDVLIVQYKDDAITTAAAVAAAGGSPAAVATAAAAAAAQDTTVAIAAAEDRGASAVKTAAIAAIASEAAATVPALTAITSAVSIAAASSGITVISQTNFATVIKGAALKTRSAADAARLKSQLEQNPAVAKVWYAGTRRLIKPILPQNLTTASVELASLPTRSSTTASATTGNAAATGLAKALTHASAQNYKLDGSGALICVVDTGINYQHALYGSCTGVNEPRGQCKVVTGYNFVGDAYNGKTDGPPTERGGPPTDCMGHGSMVASVAATANGVAPGALLGSYRVFGCQGFAVDDVIIEAIDRAVRDGCDIINLSLASGSGYDDNSVYSTVMANALAKGVLVVKAAGNAGADGPFTADEFTAAGAITAAAVGDDFKMTPLDAYLTASGFSSFGPSPSLDLLPHVSAPGAFISVETQYGTPYTASGTSFASPYISGVLALWLQSQAAGSSSRGRGAAAVTAGGVADQAAALRGLVATAKGVKAADDEAFLEPVAKVGAGVIQVDAFLTNQLHVSPLFISLPSALTEPATYTIKLHWTGQPPPENPDVIQTTNASNIDTNLAGNVTNSTLQSGLGTVTYSVVHDPAAAMTVSNGWYGSGKSIQYVYEAADVAFGAKTVGVDAVSGRPTELQVTFSLSKALASQPLLFSGIIRLQPTDPNLPAVVIPYQGYSQDWSKVPILARPNATLGSDRAILLRSRQNALCYAPRSQAVVANAVMDQIAKVPDVCTGGYATSLDQTLSVSLAVLQESPECSLRITLVPETPMQTLYIDVLQASGQVLGSIAPLDTSSGSSLATAGEVHSFCLRFDGSYKATLSGSLQWVRPGNVYRLRARLRGPWAAGDKALGRPPSTQMVYIRGKFGVEV